jgi:cytochrome P450
MKKSYTTNIIKEAMRLHSPAWAIDRQALEDDSLKIIHGKKELS